MNEYWFFFLYGIVSVWLGVSLGRLIGHYEMKSIINGYKRVAEDYKKLVYKEREIREETIDEYKKLIEILKRAYELG